MFYLYYILGYKPPSIKGCVQKSNFAIISYSHQKSFKKILCFFFWFLVFFSILICIQKKVHETEQLVQGASGQAKLFGFVLIVCEKRYKI